MSTYATRSDVENYIEGWTTDDPVALERLIRRAQRDVDRILPRTSSLTNTIIGISIDPTVTGGHFVLGMNWRGTEYISPFILWNSGGSEVVVALQSMIDQYTNPLPPGVWQLPNAKSYLAPWAFGPLPGTPVVVEAVNSLGRQALPDLTVVSNNLIPLDSVITLATIVEGGLRVNPYQLPADYTNALRDATCAQVEYRNTMGEEFFMRAQFQSVTGPEFKTTGKLPRIGPKVFQELQGTDLVQRGARARPGTSTGRQAVYAPSGTTPIPDDWRAI